MKNPINEYIANFPQNSNNIKNLWEESENAQKRAQAEYKVIRQLADEIFDQAKDEMSKLPTFDISRFQKVFSAATGGYSGNGYDLNPFQSMNDKFHKQSDRHKILKNEKQKLKSGKVVRNLEKWHNDMIGHWIKKHLPKEPRNNDTSYELFGALPKFDPRFPFDRAFKLMDDLQPPDMFKFSTNNFHI
ncbi:Uncharacterized protein BM_BM17709 [Brugia malayi]|uniref:Uncharacterized protein n=1 Tax=Brugia malayi TaxID=6279 RepID=A0A4E9FKV2_BRUMA|nr:Uncharacterized protein BM_BM17709 [Brugia malayi]VIO97585.1 Uncharacterized protein BM_BM17709 [Brugia malayi]